MSVEYKQSCKLVTPKQTRGDSAAEMGMKFDYNCVSNALFCSLWNCLLSVVHFPVGYSAFCPGKEQLPAVSANVI